MQRRRRLSVSTVSRDDLTTSSPAASASEEESVPRPDDTIHREAALEGLAIAEATALQGKKKPISPRATAPAVRKTVKDPYNELLNRIKNNSRGSGGGALGLDLGVDILLSLLEGNERTLLIFGKHTDDLRHGFDDKELKIAGTAAVLDLDRELSGIAYACKKGLKPESPNQDDFFIIKVQDWSLYGVFDGHGPGGHYVSSFVHYCLPYLILADEKFEKDPLNTMKISFHKAHKLLESACEVSSNPKIDCSLSGTTATIVLHKDNKLYVAHVGDSRAVLGRKGGPSTYLGGNAQEPEVVGNNSRSCGLLANDLTTDHKATLPNEQRRIEQWGGEVRLLQGDVPHRVFVKGMMYPGLAMSRAIGDTLGTSIGVTSEPDIKEIDLDPKKDVFVIMASDGVWEFISSQQAIEYITQKSKRDVKKAAEFLAYESWRRWVEEEESVVDDVTCLIFYL